VRKRKFSQDCTSGYHESSHTDTLINKFKILFLYCFFLNGIKLEKVLKYKYLGNIIEASGKLNSSFTELSKKGAKVLFSIFKYLSPLERVSIKLNIKSKILRYCIYVYQDGLNKFINSYLMYLPTFYRIIVHVKSPCLV
jgi:hypothetical protein